MAVSPARAWHVLTTSKANQSARAKVTGSTADHGETANFLVAKVGKITTDVL